MDIREKIKLLATAVGDGKCIKVDTQEGPNRIPKERFCAFAERVAETEYATEVFSNTIYTATGETEDIALSNLLSVLKKHHIMSLVKADRDIDFHNKKVDEAIASKREIRNIFEKIGDSF